MAHISSNVTHQPLPYHEVSAARLSSVTSDGLPGAGIPIEALGLRVDRKHIFKSCFKLSAYAREQMPTSLGGTNEVAESRLGPVSTPCFEAVTASSSKRGSLAGSPFQPVAPTEAVVSAIPGRRASARGGSLPALAASLSERYRLEGES